MATERGPGWAHHRDVAAQFRALADIEPSDSLRERLYRIAERYDGLAADWEAKQTNNQPDHG